MPDYMVPSSPGSPTIGSSRKRPLVEEDIDLNLETQGPGGRIRRIASDSDDEYHASPTLVNAQHDLHHTVQRSPSSKPVNRKESNPGQTTLDATRATRIYLKICGLEGRIASNVSLTTQLENRDPQKPGDTSRIRVLHGELHRLYHLLEGCKGSLKGQQELLSAEAGYGLDLRMDAQRERIASRKRGRIAAKDANLAALIAITAYGQQQDVDVPTLDKGYEILGLIPGRSFPGMKATLMDHQVIGVAWMSRQEKRPERSGMLADDMGLGKTIQMIATIIHNDASEPESTTTLIVAPAALLSQWVDELTSKTDVLTCYVYHGTGKTADPEELSRYDVVLTSYGTIATSWIDFEAQAHKDKCSGKSEPPEKVQNGLLYQLQWHRIVLDEAQYIRNRATRNSQAVAELRGDIRWCISGTLLVNDLADAYGYLRFMKIPVWSIWEVFQHRIGRVATIQPEVACSRMQAIFNHLLLRRMKDAMLDGKKLVDLPAKDIELQTLQFTAEERKSYTEFETHARSRFAECQALRGNQWSTALIILHTLRQYCCDPRLLGNTLISEMMSDVVVETRDDDTDDCRRKEQDRARTLMGSEFLDLVTDQFSQDGAESVLEENACCLCKDSPTEPIITGCMHVFCAECIEADWESQTTESEGQENTCPFCATVVCSQKLFHLMNLLEPHQKPTAPTRGSLQPDMQRGVQVGDLLITPDPQLLRPASTKLKFAMDYVMKLMVDSSDEKVVILSQWTSYLDIIGRELSREGVAFVEYRGLMRSDERAKSVKSLTNDDDIRVMLLSLKAGGVGLNLSRANHIISMDLPWAPAVELQAFDRVHRIGQTRPVHIQRLVIENTVEDRVLKLHERKRLLAEDILGEGRSEKFGHITMQDFGHLFGL